MRVPPRGSAEGQFEEFEASALFCGRCQRAQPVRERLLLVLPDGELREYLCGVCGSSVGQRRVQAARPGLVGVGYPG
jgi:hypothetical protein